MFTSTVSKLFCSVLFVLLSFSSARASVELGWGVGIGTQYGGVVGIQGSIGTKQTRLKLAVGYAGISGLLEQHVTDNISIGYQAFGIAFTTGWGLFLNYYRPHRDNNMWVFGLDYINSSETSFITAYGERDDFFLVSVGYKFR